MGHLATASTAMSLATLPRSVPHHVLEETAGVVAVPEEVELEEDAAEAVETNMGLHGATTMTTGATTTPGEERNAKGTRRHMMLRASTEGLRRQPLTER